MDAKTLNLQVLGKVAYEGFLALLMRASNAVLLMRGAASPQIAALCFQAAGYQKRGIHWNPPKLPIDGDKAQELLKNLLANSQYTAAHLRNIKAQLAFDIDNSKTELGGCDEE